MENYELSYPSMEEEVVGFDDDVKNITEYLTRGTRMLDVISIVGMAGIGKTALARKIYNSHSIVDHFDIRVWCSLSEIYNRRKLSIEILKQITDDHHKYVDVDYPEDIVRKLLYGRRYLIVLDNIWETKAWDDLSRCFHDGDYRSRILVTTRDKKVAFHMKAISDPYSLQFLKDEKSWELLEKKVFQGENNSCPLELRNIGRLVAKKCKGLPSLIISIAGILSSTKREASLWLEVARDITSYAYEKETSMKAIQFSYDHLPNHLKPCLLYMGLFPKGYEIPVSDLLKWWRAEGLLEESLYDLVSRSLVVVSKTGFDGTMKCCIVVDQVREFCLRKITEEKFMAQYYPRYQPVEQRLCMYVHDTMTSGHFEESQEFIVHPKFSRLDHKNPFRLLNNLRLVRVLHLLDIYLDNSLASAFQSLPHLRYLAIFVKAFDVKWVSHLLHLQTLRVCSSYVMISPAIWKMSKLRHVDINEFPFTIPSKEVGDLETLGMCYMSVADMTPGLWDKFPNLEQLRLHINEFEYLVPNALMNLEVTFPSRLRSLSLSEIFLTDEIVSSIANLQNLETLKLSEIYFTGEKHWDLGDNTFVRLKFLKLHRVFMKKWICSEESFPCLQYLGVKGCSKLEEIPDASFPQLEKLVLKDCEQLEEIPFSFVGILTLRLIKVINCSDSVCDSALSIKDEAEYNEVYARLQIHILKNY